MGWFEKLKQFVTGEETIRMPEERGYDRRKADWQALPGELEAERYPSHHYALAHIVLKDVCMHHPVYFFCVMVSPEKDEFLEMVWQWVCEICDGGGKAPFSIQDVVFEGMRIQEYPMLVALFPQPRDIAEVFMIAAVLKVPADELEEAPENPEVRYFTLELGATEDYRARTVLCEWDMSGNHVNYGDGPDPDPRAFIEAIKSLL